MISYNRGEMLREVVDSYLRLSDQIEVIVHDNGSDDPATLDSLHELARFGVKVINGRRIHTAIELDLVNETIRSYFGGAPSSRYVVTDCDVDMSIAAPDALAIYGELLDQFPEAACVGPMLRVWDLSRDYPLFNWAMNRHGPFWHQTPRWIETSAGCIAILPAPFDTTFALHRKGEDFRRLKDGIRVYFPYEARHLDWYLTDPQARTGSYGHTSSDEISHWNNIHQREIHKNEPLRYRHVVYVDRDENGGLTTKRLELKPNDPPDQTSVANVPA